MQTLLCMLNLGLVRRFLVCAFDSIGQAVLDNKRLVDVARNGSDLEVAL